MKRMNRPADNGRKKHSQGFTLVETVVAFALAAILFAALFSVIAPAYRMYQRTRANADAQMLAGNILDTIRTTAMTAAELTGDGDTVHVGRRNTFTIANGRLQYNGVDVYDEKYYDGKTISIHAEQIGENIIRVAVEVTKSEMLTATATGVIAPIRRILGEEGDALAQSELERAQQVAKDNPGHSGGALFEDLYIGADGENTGFEAYDIHKIFTAARLRALREQAEALGTEADRAFFAQLEEKTFYLAVYFAETTGQPVAYLTDVEKADNNAGNPVYFVYYDGKWYMRNPNRLPADAMGNFDGRNHYNIINYLNEGQDFILAENVALPLPQ